MPTAPRPNWLPALVFLVLASACQTGGATQEALWPTDGWATSTPAEQGLVAAPLAELDAAIRGGTYGYIDRMVVVRNGYLVVSERYDND